MSLKYNLVQQINIPLNPRLRGNFPAWNAYYQLKKQTLPYIEKNPNTSLYKVGNQENFHN